MYEQTLSMVIRKYFESAQQRSDEMVEVAEREVKTGERVGRGNREG